MQEAYLSHGECKAVRNEESAQVVDSYQPSALLRYVSLVKVTTAYREKLNLSGGLKHKHSSERDVHF